MRWFLLLGLLGCLLCSFSPIAPPHSIHELQAQYRLLEALHEQGQVSDSVFVDQRTALERYAAERFELTLHGEALTQAVTAQRIDWLGSALYIAAGLVLLVILGPLLRKLWYFSRDALRALWALKPLRLFLIRLGKILVVIWEPLAYLLAAYLLYAYPHELVVLLVSVVLSSLVTYTVYSHRGDQIFTRLEGTLIAWILTVLWGGIAYYFDHTWVGLGAVGALIAGLGFSLLLLPEVRWLSFRKKHAWFVLRMTVLLLGLSVLSALIFHLDILPTLAAWRIPLRPFELGLTTLVPIGYFFGLGYLVMFIAERKISPWQRFFAHLGALLFAFGTVALALLFQIGSLFWMGSFFAVALLTNHYYLFFYRRVDPIWTGLLVAGLLAVGGYVLKQHLSEVVAFLVKLGW